MIKRVDETNPAIFAYDIYDEATWPAAWNGVKWGDTIPFLHLAKHYDVPYEHVATYADFIQRGGRTRAYVAPGPSDWRKSLTHSAVKQTDFQTMVSRPGAWEEIAMVAKRYRPVKR